MLQRRESYSVGELLEFVHSIYRATDGKYPLLEWVDEKPSPEDFPAFKSVYEPFLRRRMDKEFDEMYVWGKQSIEATAALVYDFEGKDMEWIPESFRRKGNAFIEFFMVSPSLWGRGYGKKILAFLLDEIRRRKMHAHVSTSDIIDAYDFYIKNGFREVGRHGIFIIMRHD
ncbi:MAG: GNAT family N-acetyltransferase [Thermoplasmata archaeon]|nr:GNAT family N-acetyltransferase [Thermoplasmata archaeon]